VVDYRHNPTYSGGRDQENWFKASPRVISSGDPVSKKPQNSSQKMSGRVAQAIKVLTSMKPCVQNPTQDKKGLVEYSSSKSKALVSIPRTGEKKKNHCFPS
jgi:hypothetical protein